LEREVKGFRDGEELGRQSEAHKKKRKEKMKMADLRFARNIQISLSAIVR